MRKDKSQFSDRSDHNIASAKTNSRKCSESNARKIKAGVFDRPIVDSFVSPLLAGNLNEQD